MTVPPETITAAAKALEHSLTVTEGDPGAFYRARARIALEAAAPLIAAAQREADARLAEREAEHANLTARNARDIAAAVAYRKLAALLREEP